MKFDCSNEKQKERDLIFFKYLLKKIWPSPSYPDVKSMALSVFLKKYQAQFINNLVQIYVSNPCPFYSLNFYLSWNLTALNNTVFTIYVKFNKCV